MFHCEDERYQLDTCVDQCNAARRRLRAMAVALDALPAEARQAATLEDLPLGTHPNAVHRRCVDAYVFHILWSATLDASKHC